MRTCATCAGWRFSGCLNWGPLVLFFWLCLVLPANGNEADDFFEEWQQNLGTVSEEIQRRLSRSDTEDCDCALYACGSEPSDSVTQCLNSFHEEDDLECGVAHCSHMKVSLSTIGDCWTVVTVKVVEHFS